MDPTSQLIDSFEKYLKEDLKKQKEKIKEIEHNLELIKSFKQKYRLSSGKNGAETDLTSDLFDQIDNNFEAGLPGQSSSTPIPNFIEKGELYLNNAKQFFMMTDEEEGKTDLITQLFKCQPIENAIIYCNSTKNVENLTTFMIADGFNVHNLVGKSTKKRNQMIEDLNCGDLEIEALITVRSIDSLTNISLIVNYDLPTRESYIKKAGSRLKNCYKYFVVNIITKHELNKLMSYGKHFNTNIVSLPITTIYSVDKSTIGDSAEILRFNPSFI